MKFVDECPECLTKSMAQAYVCGIGNVEYCVFCKDVQPADRG